MDIEAVFKSVVEQLPTMSDSEVRDMYYNTKAGKYILGEGDHNMFLAQTSRLKQELTKRGIPT